MSAKAKEITLVFRATVTATRQEFQEALERKIFVKVGEDFLPHVGLLEIRDLQDDFEVESSFEEIA